MAEFDHLDREVDAACAAGDRPRAVAAIEAWRSWNVDRFTGILASCPLEAVNRDEAILARWPGTCPACGERIERGTLIVRDDDEWIHDGCFPEREDVAAAVGRMEAERS